MKEGGFFFKRWRYRIEKMQVFLLRNSQSQSMIKNPGSFSKGYFFGITYPLIFKDQDSSLKSHTFKSLYFHCYSIFKAYGNKEEDIGEQCSVRNGFDVQPSPDGIFHFQMLNASPEIIKKFHAIKINIKGTRIPFYFNGKFQMFT